MAKYVYFSMDKEVDVGIGGFQFDVYENDRKLGRFIIGKTGMDFYPKNAKRPQKEWTWEELIQEGGGELLDSTQTAYAVNLLLKNNKEKLTDKELLSLIQQRFPETGRFNKKQGPKNLHWLRTQINRGEQPGVKKPRHPIRKMSN
jgi:hypothetical protein